VSNADEPDKKPPQAADPNATQRLPVQGSEPDPGATQRLPVQDSEPDPGATQRLPVQESGVAPAAAAPVEPEAPPPPSVTSPPADAGATVMFTAEDIAKLEEESAAADGAAEEADRLIGTLIRDKWKVLKRLGAGSFGTVYKVEDVTGGWIEALKILGVDRMTGGEAEEMRARFLREAQIMKRLGKESKHIVGLSTYEEDIESGLVYFLMEFVEGRSLADALEDDGPFPTDRAVQLALQVCDALMVAHEGPEPVVHRDLKLENLMLTKDRAGEEMVKVLDFGIAKIAEREADSRLTTVGTLGTPGYAAPEQLRAEAVDGRTDLFAFGVILYALLTGRDPWLGNLAHQPTHQIYELMVATDRAEVRPMSEAGPSIPPEMVNVVMKLLRRDPAQRFQSARELRDTLLHIQSGTAPAMASAGAAPTSAPASSGGTATASPPSATQGRETDRESAAPRARPATQKKRGIGTFVALGLVVLATGAAMWARPWGRTLDADALVARASNGSIPTVWLTADGVEGGLQVVPGLSGMLVPFSSDIPADERGALITRLRDAGASVDASWEVRRLLDLAVEAQGRGRYYGADGTDVQSYALQLAALDPESAEAASLLLKVGERMAWDAEVARTEGPEGRADQLLTACLQLVPGHPRCSEVAGQSP
jgi:serine/threonine-protein kinase